MARIALPMAFAALLIIANIVAVKLLAIGDWVLSAGIVAYPFTFLVTDTLSEVYGRRTATRVVWMGFALSVLMAALVYLTRILPAPGFWEGQAAYDDTLGSVPRIVLASMIAFLVSQNTDVLLFHRIGRLTGQRFLWLRNNGSTMASQAIDTLLFVSIAFAGTESTATLLNMMVTQYVVKLAIAAADTPFVYLLVGIVRRSEGIPDGAGPDRPANRREGGPKPRLTPHRPPRKRSWWIETVALIRIG